MARQLPHVCRCATRLLHFPPSPSPALSFEVMAGAWAHTSKGPSPSWPKHTPLHAICKCGRRKPGQTSPKKRLNTLHVLSVRVRQAQV
eukprot:366156-Chlamydomonas_euryale.AAC.2